ncbi:hypothetical protein AB0N17_23045 [Streptomyces sp. NPDC051133]|uniref:hypothetical protein n=1 Tax=Streptomyces sp. NPDC051133 TaxID=3155521 RepID=UPI003412B7F0
MGIRTLHRRTPEADTRAWADTASAQALPASPVPALAADASTARIPADVTDTVRRAAKDLRRTLAGQTTRTGRTPGWCQWADLARGYLALALTLLPSARPRPTLTIFVASLTERPAAPAAGPQPHREPRDPQAPQDRPRPGPDDATP